MAKRKKTVETRWFLWQPQTRLLGGVVAPDAATAFYGLSADERLWLTNTPGACMVKVRMEYPCSTAGKGSEQP